MSAVNPNGLLAGKVAIVTGSSRGIGEAIAIRYAMEGAKVVVSARTEEEGQHMLPGAMSTVVHRIKQAGGEAIAVRCDMGVPEDRENLVKQTVDAFGPVDILVNNAAVTFLQPISDFSDKRMRLMFEVQVFGPMHLSQMVLQSMKERGSGWILNISSHAAIHPPLSAAGGGTVYGMCKAALERFTTGLAAEVNPDGIGVNVISPGLVATPGVVYHKLINDSNRDTQTPVEHMAEACLRLVHGDPKTLSGRITYASDIMKEYNLQAAELV
ncbi:MAG: SDR family NAD(P)-dependent oxidoreductase [Dehalococcoidia bacterium]|nr:SDR family NAD(P)-dependent oxidoreductase [Dehalococcoidia bacterium]